MDYTVLMRALAAVSLCGFAAWGIGNFLIRPFWKFESSVLRAAVSMSLGLLLISHTLFLLSSAQLLTIPVRTSWWIVLLMIGLLSFLRVIPTLIRYLRQPFGTWALLLTIAIYFSGILLCTLLPATVRDEIIYHLEVPKRLLEHGGQFPFVDNFYAYFPALGDMLFMLGLSSGMEEAAKFFHPLWGVILSLALYGMSRRHLSKNWSLFTILLMFSAPSMLVSMTQAYVDITYCVFFLLALHTVLQFFETSQIRWIVLAGILSGGAVATKYTGIQFLILLEVLLMIEYLFSRRKEFVPAFFMLGSIALLAGSPYFIRNWIFTGWPLFPFQILNMALKPGLNWDAARSNLYMGWVNSFGEPLEGATIFDKLFAPIWVFVRGQFERPEFYDGKLNPVFLLTPFFLIKTKRKQALNWIAFFSILFIYYWVFTTKQIRFVLPVIPLLSLLLVWGLSLRSRIFLIPVLLFMPWGIWNSIQEIKVLHPQRYWSGLESRPEYLERNIENYRIYQKINELLSPGDKIYFINMKNYGYYMNIPWNGDFVFERYSLDQAVDEIKTPEDFMAFFQRYQANHIVLDSRFLYSKDFGFAEDKIVLFKEFLEKYTEFRYDDSGMFLYRLLSK